jgi:hypothetical protein
MNESTFTGKVFLWLTILFVSSAYASWAQTGPSRKKVGQERPVSRELVKKSITPNWTAVEKSLVNRPAISAVRTKLTDKQAARYMTETSKSLMGPSFSKLKPNTLNKDEIREAKLKRNENRKALLERNRKNGSVALRRTADDPLTKLYVNEFASLSSTEDGSSWENAYVQLADALKFAKDHSSVTEIWVAHGVYKPLYATDYSNSEPNADRDNAFVLPPNVKIYGGFYGVETLLEERDLRDAENFGFFLGGGGDVTATILSGDFDDNDVVTEGSFTFTSENARHVVISSGDVGEAALDGLIITGGNADEESFLTTVGFENVSQASGAGLALYNSSPALTNLVILHHQAISGSAIYAVGSAPVITNTLIISNKAETGTLYLQNSSPVVTNATISGNIANNAGGIYFTGATDAASIRNTIIFGNTAASNPNISVGGGIAPSYQYSIVEGSGGSSAWMSSFGTDGDHNLDVDPKFNDPTFQNYGLSVTSPAINAGNSALFLSGSPDLSGILTDVRGTARIKKGDIDIGAIESLFAVLSSDLVHNNGRLYVKKGSTGNGSSWATPTGEVADALFAAALNPDIQEIWVAGGVYHPLYRPDDLSIEPNGKLNTFVMVPNVRIYGGFQGNEGSLAGRDLRIVANASILSADFNEDDALDFHAFSETGEMPLSLEENALHILYAIGETGDAVLDGFTIEGANIMTTVFSEDEPDISNVLNESLHINGSEIPVMFGGAVTLMGSKMALSNLVVKNNLGLLGGGVTAVGYEMLLTNTLIYDNFAALLGSGLLCLGVDMRMINVTITGNFVYPLMELPGTGVFVSSGLSRISNSIIYGNLYQCCPSDFLADFEDDDDLVISNSLIGESGGSEDWSSYMGTDGGGNLDEDPVFKDVLAKDFSLTACSRPINAGTNIYFDESGTPDLSSMLTDLAGNVRIYNEIVDMGALEFQGESSTDQPPLAGDGRESYFEFDSQDTHVFTVPSGVCSSDLLALTPTHLSGGVYAVTWLDPQVNFFNGAPYVQRHFDIEPIENPDDASARVTLYFYQAEFDKFNEEVDPSEYLPTGEAEGEEDRIGNLRIYQFHGLSYDWSGDPSTYEGGRTPIDPDDEDIVWNAALSRWEVSFDVQAFSGFFAGTKTQSPLPVRLVTFRGKLTDEKKVRLEWQVAEQDQIDAYAIEYSANGKAFSEIGKVFANSLTSTQYSYNDREIRMGQYAYYRLRVMEMSGEKSYSRIAAVKLPASQHMVIYPVPAKTHVWVNWKGSLANSAELIDIFGRVLKTISRQEEAQRIDISGYTPGVYFLRMADSGAVKILKE